MWCWACRDPGEDGGWIGRSGNCCTAPGLLRPPLRLKLPSNLVFSHARTRTHTHTHARTHTHPHTRTQTHIHCGYLSHALSHSLTHSLARSLILSVFWRLFAFGTRVPVTFASATKVLSIEHVVSQDCLVSACYAGDHALVAAALRDGASVNTPGSTGDGPTMDLPLAAAASRWQEAVVTTLLAAGADVNASGVMFTTARRSTPVIL